MRILKRMWDGILGNCCEFFGGIFFGNYISEKIPLKNSQRRISNDIICLMAKKKILYLITKGNWGGAQKYVFDLASELEEFEVVVAHGKPFGELSEKLKEAGIRTIEITDLERDIDFLGEFWVAKKLWKILKKEKPDVVHLNSSKIGGMGALVCRLFGIKKIIYTAHGWAFNEKRSFWQIWLIKFLSWLTILLCHKTIVVAKKEYKQVIDWPFITKDGIRLIYNGIKPIYFFNREEAQGILEEKIGQSLNGNFVIGTISELTKNKGLKYAIDGLEDIVKGNNRVKFIVIGEGEDRGYLEKEIRDEGLEDRIFLVGQIEEAGRYLKAFDILLLSSIKEGFPFVLLEAGLAGLPVIATEVGGIPEIIVNNKTGILIEPKEDDDIESAMKELVENEYERDLLGKNLKKEVKKDFSFEEMVEKTVGLY